MTEIEFKLSSAQLKYLHLSHFTQVDSQSVEMFLCWKYKKGVLFVWEWTQGAESKAIPKRTEIELEAFVDPFYLMIMEYYSYVFFRNIR